MAKESKAKSPNMKGAAKMYIEGFKKRKWRGLLTKIQQEHGSKNPIQKKTRPKDFRNWEDLYLPGGIKEMAQNFRLHQAGHRKSVEKKKIRR